MRSKQVVLGTLLVALLLTVACAHRVSGKPATPWEKLSTDNDIFAQLNNTIEQGAEAVAASGVRSPAQIFPVINLTEIVAKDHKEITAIIAKGPTVSLSDYQSIKDLTDQIKQSGTNLITSGGIAVKNPKSQQDLSKDVQAVVTLADAILQEVITIKGGVQ